MAPTIQNMIAITSSFSLSGFTWTPVFATAASSYAIQQSDNGTGTVFRFEIRSGDQTPEDIAAGTNVERCEVNGTALDQTKIINFTFQQMVEAGSAISSGAGQFFVVGQLHATPDAGDISTVPPIRQSLTPGDILQYIFSAYVPDLMTVTPPSFVSYEAQITRDVWYRYKYRFKYATDGTGFLQVWQNDVLVVNYKGPLGYTDQNGPYPKFGIYRSPAPETMVVWYSDISLSYEV